MYTRAPREGEIGWELARSVVIKNQGKAIRLCSNYLKSVGEGYLGTRLQYDVSSEFGNTRVLLDVWLRVFGGDDEMLISFYEGVYEENPLRLESVIALFLVAFASSLLAGMASVEYQANRSRLHEAIREMQVRCRRNLRILFNKYALKAALEHHRITLDEYLKMNKEIAAKRSEGDSVPKTVQTTLEPYFSKLGFGSADELLVELEKFASNYSEANLLDRSESELWELSKGWPTLRGLGVSPGVAGGTPRIIDKVDSKPLTKQDVGIVYVHIVPEMVPVLKDAGGLVGVLGAGGQTSHLAVIARALGIPAVTEVSDYDGLLKSAKNIVIEGTNGEIRLLRE